VFGERFSLLDCSSVENAGVLYTLLQKIDAPVYYCSVAGLELDLYALDVAFA